MKSYLVEVYLIPFSVFCFVRCSVLSAFNFGFLHIDIYKVVKEFISAYIYVSFLYFAK